MTLRDLHHWDFFKLILIIELLIGVLLIPIILLMAFFTHDLQSAITVDGKANGLLSKDLIMTIPIAFLFSLIFAMFKASALMWICQFTPIGNIKIGNMAQRKNRA